MALVLCMVQLALAQDVQPDVGAAGVGGQDYYLIQPGDTLWDISERFLGAADQWPGLWSLNEYITNPHWIYPGNRIYFHLGDELNPPGVGLIEEKSEGYQPPPAVVVNEETLCDFPPIFDEVQKSQKLLAPGVLSTAKDLNLRGEVFGATVPGTVLGEGEYVFLNVDDADELDCGDILGVYRKVDDDVKGAGGADIYRILGDARVVRVDDDTVTAQLRDTTAEIVRGDLIGSPTPFRMRLDVLAPSGDLRATVVARLGVDVRMPAESEVVFIDRGTDDGIDVGTALFVIEQQDGLAVTEIEPDDRYPERVIGRVVVVRAEESRATAVVVDAARELETGMRLATLPNAKDD